MYASENADRAPWTAATHGPFGLREPHCWRDEFGSPQITCEAAKVAVYELSFRLRDWRREVMRTCRRQKKGYNLAVVP